MATAAPSADLTTYAPAWPVPTLCVLLPDGGQQSAYRPLSCQDDRASPEASAGHSCAVDAVCRKGDGHGLIQFCAGDFVIVAQGFMRGCHKPSETSRIARGQRLRGAEHSPVFCDDVSHAPEKRRIQ